MGFVFITDSLFNVEALRQTRSLSAVILSASSALNQNALYALLYIVHTYRFQQ